MPLSVVAEVVAQGGFLPQLAQLNEKKSILTRRNGVTFSILWCLFFLLIMTPLWGIADVERLAGASAIIGIFGGMLMLISSLVFLKKPYVSYGHPPVPHQQAGLYGHPQQGALPPQQSVPASQYAMPSTGRWRDTNDLEPTSVTESTTRLLNEEDRK